MSRKESLHKPHAVRNKKAETDTEETRADAHGPIPTGELGLTQDQRRSNQRCDQLFEECTRVTANPSLNVGIFKEHLVDFGEQLAKESRFSRAAGPRDNHRGEMSGRLTDHTYPDFEVCIACEYL
jgi:hypothetical protein